MGIVQGETGMILRHQGTVWLPIWGQNQNHTNFGVDLRFIADMYEIVHIEFEKRKIVHMEIRKILSFVRKIISKFEILLQNVTKCIAIFCLESKIQKKSPAAR